MMLPAYSMDAAPIAYETHLQSADERGADAMRGPSAQSRVLQVASGTDRPRYLVASAALDQPEAASDAVGNQPALVANRRAPAPAAQVRSQLARIAFVCGWLFLGIALFCFAQSLFIFGRSRARRYWRLLPAQS